MANSLRQWPLDRETNEFRLPTILFDADSTYRVRCTLDIYSLIDPPPYYVLSYVWGDLQKTVGICINGATSRAMRNLENALRALQRRLRDPSDVVTSTLAASHTGNAARASKAPSSKAYRIRADAVCINQADIDERDTQALRMRDIYCHRRLAGTA